MKLSLHPNPGNGMTWELTLEVSGLEFAVEAGLRRRAGGDEALWRAEAWRLARHVATELGLTKVEIHDDDHGTWTQ